MPGRYAQLHTLRLVRAPLANRDVLRLQGLPLRELNLRGTGLGDEAYVLPQSLHMGMDELTSAVRSISSRSHQHSFDLISPGTSF